MKLTITIEMDNAAFESGNGAEVSRILRGLAAKINNEDLAPGDSWPCLDANANKVGMAEVSEGWSRMSRN